MSSTEISKKVAKKFSILKLHQIRIKNVSNACSTTLVLKKQLVYKKILHWYFCANFVHLLC